MNKMDVSLLNLDDDSISEICLNTDLISLYMLLRTNKRIREICGDIMKFRYLALAYATLEKSWKPIYFKVEKLPSTFILVTHIDGRGPWSITEGDEVWSTLRYEYNVTFKIITFLDTLRLEQQNKLDKITDDLSLKYVDKEENEISKYFSLIDFVTELTIKGMVNKLVGIFLNGGEVTILRHGSNSDLGEASIEEIYQRARDIEIILSEKS